MRPFFKHLLSAWAVVLALNPLKGQSIVDPCFTSQQELGFYYGSDDIINVCRCFEPKRASDMMEWNGTEWLGRHPNSQVDLPPPDSCQERAIWFSPWTTGGEGFGLRLTEPFVTGKTYAFTFTYASDGINDNDNFSPQFYTNSSFLFDHAFFVGRLTPTDGWHTETFTFTAQPAQEGHNWIFLYTTDAPGMVLSNCIPANPLHVDNSLLRADTTICDGTSITLAMPEGDYTYHWSTGDDTQTITVSDSGYYWGRLQYNNCGAYDSIRVLLKDCEIRLTMPNFFSPNGDEYNNDFIPKDYNLIESGELFVFNRWGKQVFGGDLFTGWDGHTGGKEAADGIYFYEIEYRDVYGVRYLKKGTLTLRR